MLGLAAADTLEKRVGDVLSLPGGVFRVTGIYETGVAYEEGGGVVALPDANATKVLYVEADWLRTWS